jgi:hypothetical protein
MEECRLDSSGWGQGQVAGSCEHGNEPYKVKGISWLAGGLLASQGQCSKESESATWCICDINGTTQENFDGKRHNYPPKPTPSNIFSDGQRLHQSQRRTLTKAKQILKNKQLFIQKSQKEKVQWEIDQKIQYLTSFVCSHYKT